MDMADTTSNREARQDLDPRRTMRTLAVMAHYDATGQIAPHAMRQIDALAGAVDRLMVVSTAVIEDPHLLAEVQRRAELVRRPNFGYDFYSYKTGLDLVEDLRSYDLVIICNDSYVGPLRDYRRILDEMADRPVDFWGMTCTERRALHVQSFFVAFRGWVVGSHAFTDFWRAMTPISDRMEVIKRYELGLSGALLAAGFRVGSVFEETPQDRRLARARHLWWAANTVRGLPRSKRRAAWRRLPFEPWNPMAAMADRALDGARLPVVKIDTLRYDPYRLGSDHLLEACERRYPEQFDGVRAYLERTAELYPVRPGESQGPTSPPVPLRQLIGYAR
jgi:rhamnosyltransferase